MKKAIVFVSLLFLTAALAFAGGSQSSGSSGGSGSGGVPAVVNAPITIEFWHSRATGANLDQLKASIEAFNRENKLGIKVEEVYQGSNTETIAKATQAIAGGTAPALVTLTSPGITQLASNGVLADMRSYADRDKASFDVGNYLDALMEFSYYKGQLISFPYVRSTAVMYYNIDMYNSVGQTTPPKTIKELREVSRKLTTGDVKGFGMLNDDWYINNFLWQIGSAQIDADDKGMKCLTDGSLLRVFTEWRTWVDEGWCVPPALTASANALRDLFYQGKLAAFFESSGGMTNIINASRTNNRNLGVCFLPYLDDGKPASPAGGTNVSIISGRNSQQAIAAAWEFIKFISNDYWSADNAIKTGYLPITKSAATAPALIDLWRTTPIYRVAYDQLRENGHDYPFSIYLSETKAILQDAGTALIIDRSITPEQAVQQVARQVAPIFR
jgi:ABC-type glycerol-3-phosphate transport system substrate-binding protein